MTVIPLASTDYPESYSASLDQPLLQTLETPFFHTHISPLAEKLHHVSETLLLPGRWSLQLLGYSITPLPGAHKDHPWLGLAIRITALALWSITLPIAGLSLALSFPLRCIDHRYRPLLSYINNSTSPNAHPKSALPLSEAHPLHLRTHNLALINTATSTAADLRAPEERARETAYSIIHDPHPPDIIFFQEAFHEDACRILCEGIKEEYPYIVHTIAPHILGLNSGAMVASKYPIEQAEFTRFERMIGPENLSPRGIIKIRVHSEKGPLLLYGVHTQAMMSDLRSKIRYEQIEMTRNLMEKDLIKEPTALQVLLGDFNSSSITPWGDDNTEPQGQAEASTLHHLHHHFDDLYLRDHHPITGVRTSKQPIYLQDDNARLGEHLTEPTASWYHGPLAHPGALYARHMAHDRQKHNRPAPKKAPITLVANLWGTPKWRSQQGATTARFDYILLPKHHGIHKLDGQAEIRRPWVPPGSQSASSDHLPVDARIWITP